MPEQILKDVFGYDRFRPGQAEVVSTLLAGEHALAVMPTGSGKSLCFQIPALIKGGLTLVVSPLVALMEDQVSALKLAGVAAETINSSRARDINVAYSVGSSLTFEAIVLMLACWRFSRRDY